MERLRYFGLPIGDARAQSSATFAPSPPDVIVARSQRLPIALTIIVSDMLGTATCIMLLAPWFRLTHDLVIVFMMVVVTSETLGLYQVGCLFALRRSISSSGAFYTILLLAATLWTLPSYDFHSACRVAGAIACGGSLALVGRTICGLAIQACPKLFAERHVVIGLRTNCYRLLRTEATSFIQVVAVGDPHACSATEVHSPGLQTSTLSLPDRIDRITVVKAGLTDIQLKEILEQLDPFSSPVTVLSDVLEDVDSSIVAGNAWLVRSAPMRSRTAIIKRALDLVVSAIAVMLLSPLLFAIAVAIRMETPGPALFRQLRHGRDRRPFTVLKFRTMRIDPALADGSVQAVRRDRRVTCIGSLLRKTSIDELPQLLNVLGGSMSLVGPRPHPLPLDHLFVPLIERYSARHRVVPGITGWAQVNGCRGETKTVEQMRRRVELDLEYIRNHSIGFDLLILFRTLSSLITHRDAAY